MSSGDGAECELLIFMSDLSFFLFFFFPIFFSADVHSAFLNLCFSASFYLF